MPNIIHYPAISTLGWSSPGDDGNFLWRIATKTGNLYNNKHTMELVFRYTETADFDFTRSVGGGSPVDYYMTLYHIGTTASADGFAVVLYKPPSPSTDIQVGVIYSSASDWVQLSGSFFTLDDVITDGYMVMFQYDYTGGTTDINFTVTKYGEDADPAAKTTADDIFTTSSGPSVNTSSIGQWGFGCSPQNLTYGDSNVGYISTDN